MQSLLEGNIAFYCKTLDLLKQNYTLQRKIIIKLQLQDDSYIIYKDLPRVRADLNTNNGSQAEPEPILREIKKIQ